MDEKSLKTSWKQRIVMFAIAILMVGSITLTYILMVLNGMAGSSNNNTIAELQSQYQAKNDELAAAAKPLSEQYFNDFVKYKSEIKAYNTASANSDGLQTKDLKPGTGRTLAEGDTNYSAYYIGWCADGTIFDSSFDDKDNPTSLKTPLDASVGLIEGWNQGVVGMQLGGVRQLSMPGDLAYKDNNEVCGGQPNTPLKFIVLAFETDAKIKSLNDELKTIYAQMMAAYSQSSGSGF